MEENLKDIVFGGMQEIVDNHYGNHDWEVIIPECRYLRNVKTGEVEELQPCPNWEGAVAQEYEGSFTKLKVIEKALKEDEEEFPLFI